MNGIDFYKHINIPFHPFHKFGCMSAVDSGDLGRRTLTDKAASITDMSMGFTTYPTGSYPSLAQVTSLSAFAKMGHLPQVSGLWLKDMDISTVPPSHLAALACSDSDMKTVDINNVQGDLSPLLSHLQCMQLYLSNISLSASATRALVTGMETGIEVLSLFTSVHGHGGDVLLDMNTLTQYSGTGRCCQVMVVFDGSKTRYKEEVKMWARRMGWRISVEKCNVIIIKRN